MLKQTLRTIKTNICNVHLFFFIYIYIYETRRQWNKEKQEESYIRDTADFLGKLKAAGEVPKGTILVTADVVGLYPSILHSEGLDIVKKHYENYPNKKVSTEDIVNMADFILKNNLFEFDSKFYK